MAKPKNVTRPSATKVVITKIPPRTQPQPPRPRKGDGKSAGK